LLQLRFEQTLSIELGDLSYIRSTLRSWLFFKSHTIQTFSWSRDLGLKTKLFCLSWKEVSCKLLCQIFFRLGLRRLRKLRVLNRSMQFDNLKKSDECAVVNCDRICQILSIVFWHGINCSFSFMLICKYLCVLSYESYLAYNIVVLPVPQILTSKGSALKIQSLDFKC